MKLKTKREWKRWKKGRKRWKREKRVKKTIVKVEMEKKSMRSLNGGGKE